MDTEFWNQRYGEPGYAYGEEPNAYMVSHAERFRPGLRALAVGDGEGRNGVWLARQGLEVLSVDASQVGLQKAQALAAKHGVPLRTACVNLTSWDWPQAAFDRVVAIFVHFPPAVRASLHAAMLAALRPGGLLLMESFTPQQLQYKSGGPPVHEMLYTPAMLREDFPNAEILELDERVVELDEGPYHSGPAAVVRLLLRRP